MSETIDPVVNPASDPTRNASYRRFWITLFSVFGIGGILACMLMPVTRSAREPARRSQCKNNLKQIGLALHNYAEVNHALPPAYTVDSYGNPLHSWRTLILPYLDQEPLYKTIDLSKPWNDPANADAFKTRLSAYQCPSGEFPENHSVYLASAGSNGCFHLTEPRSFSEITDGLDQTIMVVEVSPEQSVPWMSPVDVDGTLILELGRGSKLPHRGGTHALFCDGAVRFLSTEMPTAEFQALISIAGGDGFKK